jgi:hypothetical protein
VQLLKRELTPSAFKLWSARGKAAPKPRATVKKVADCPLKHGLFAFVACALFDQSVFKLFVSLSLCLVFGLRLFFFFR